MKILFVLAGIVLLLFSTPARSQTTDGSGGMQAVLLNAPVKAVGELRNAVVACLGGQEAALSVLSMDAITAISRRQVDEDTVKLVAMVAVMNGEAVKYGGMTAAVSSALVARGIDPDEIRELNGAIYSARFGKASGMFRAYTSVEDFMAKYELENRACTETFTLALKGVGVNPSPPSNPKNSR